MLEDIRKEDPLIKASVLELAPLKTSYTPNPLLLSLDQLKSNLSTRQLEAITSAFANGYDELPREAQVERHGYIEELMKNIFEKLKGKL